MGRKITLGETMTMPTDLHHDPEPTIDRDRSPFANDLGTTERLVWPDYSVFAMDREPTARLLRTLVASQGGLKNAPPDRTECPNLAPLNLSIPVVISHCHRIDRDDARVIFITPEAEPTTSEETNGHLFTWIIAANNDAHSSELNATSAIYFRNSFSELTIPSDSGLRKASWRRGILNAHISRFTIDPTNPLQIQRHVVELIINKNALISVDHSGDCSHLHQLRNDINDREMLTGQCNTAGGLATHILEDQLNHNSTILDALDEKIHMWEEAVVQGALPRNITSKQIPEVRRTIRFFERKVSQSREVLIAFRQAGSQGRSIFGEEPIDTVLHGCEQSLRNLLSRTAQVRERLRDLVEDHDRMRKVRSDSIMEQFTILIGLTAPPIIADFVCKYPLAQAHEWHAPLILGSIGAGIGLVAVAKATDWMFHFHGANKA